MDRAVGLAAEILDDLEDTVAGLTLVPGEGGVFDVEVDGKTVWSKHTKGTFPAYTDIAGAFS